MIYVVVGPGRTGSNLICQLISSNDFSQPGGICNAIRSASDNPYDVQRALDRADNIVIHSHEPDVVQRLGLDPEEVVLILSKRRDLFQLIMSHAVTYRTQEWHSYSNKPTVPTPLDITAFRGWYKGFKKWFDDVDTSLPFNKIVTAYFEDFNDISQANDYLSNLLGITDGYLRYRTPLPGSPYNFKDWIPNWQQVHHLYLSLEDPSYKISL
jgi:hypothetical protein